MAEDNLQEIDLIQGETILSLKAEKDVDSFDVFYVSPLNYGDQVPILLDMGNKTSSNVKNFQIFDDIHPPNQLIKFTINPLKKDEKVLIHFEYYILVKNNEYIDLPRYLKIFNKNNLPDDIKKWLLPSKSIQSDNILIKIKAYFLKGLNNNLISLAEKIVFSICYHRILLTNIRRLLESYSPFRKFFFKKRYWTGLMDALSALLFGGLCASQTNLCTALLRAKNVPTRTLISTSMFYGKKKWLDAQHYLFEVYCGEYGWIRGMAGRFPYETNSSIVLRINYPSDENLAGNGLSHYGGATPWFWINNENISLICPEIILKSKNERIKGYGAPYVRGWIEKEINTDINTVNNIFETTVDTWKFYTKYVGINLSKENKYYFENAVSLQKDAINELKNSNTRKYIYLINQVCNYYKKLSLSYPINASTNYIGDQSTIKNRFTPY